MASRVSMTCDDSNDRAAMPWARASASGTRPRLPVTVARLEVRVPSLARTVML